MFIANALRGHPSSVGAARSGAARGGWAQLVRPRSSMPLLRSLAVSGRRLAINMALLTELFLCRPPQSSVCLAYCACYRSGVKPLSHLLLRGCLIAIGLLPACAQGFSAEKASTSSG